MNKGSFKRWLSMLLTILMLFTALPIGSFATETENRSNVEYIEGKENEEKYELLGKGFNALSNNELKDVHLETVSGNIINFDAVRGMRLSTGHSQASAEYAKSAQELMVKLGVDFSNTLSVNLPIKFAKFGLSSKFGYNNETINKTITESLYYYYREETTKEKYSLILTDRLYDNPDGIIHEDFRYALEKLNSDNSNDACAGFFEKWGTHVLISYDKGASLEYVAIGHSTGTKFSENKEITSEISGSVGVGDYKVKDTLTLAEKIGVEYSADEYNLSHKWYAVGGEPGLISTGGTDAKDIKADSIDKWKDSVANDTAVSVMIPQSTEWISIWELIPDTYSSAKEALQAFYKDKAASFNQTFFDKFTTYSDVTGKNTVYYQSSTGRYFPIEYTTNMAVAPGSKFNVVDLEADMSKINFVVSPNGSATIDQYGMVSVSQNVADGTVIKVSFQDRYGKEVGQKTFSVKKEGGGFFAGGYGDANRPYLLNNKTQLLYLDEDVYGQETYFMLISDIKMDSFNDPIKVFKANLDGNGYKLYDGSFSTNDSMSEKYNYVGIIKENQGTIKNLVISNFKVYKGHSNYDRNELNAGILCGRNSGTIENVVVANCTLDVIHGCNHEGFECGDILVNAGGLCGVNHGNVIKCGVKNSPLTCIVRSRTHSDYAACGRFGGLIGVCCPGANVSDSYAYGNTMYGNAYGFIKKNWLGVVTVRALGKIDVGGLIGTTMAFSDNQSQITIERCIAYNNNFTESSAGPQTDWKYFEGAIVARIEADNADVRNCYYQTNDMGANNTSKLNLVGWDVPMGAPISENKITSLTATGVLSKLDNFERSGWVQPGNTGTISIAQNESLRITGGDRYYYLGEPLNIKGLTIKPITNNEHINSSTGLVKNGFKVTGYDPNKLGKQIVTVTYGQNSVGNAYSIQGTYEVTVVEDTISELQIVEEPHQTIYNLGDKLDYSGMVVYGVYESGKIKPLDTLTDSMFSVKTFTEIGEQEVTVSFGGQSASFMCTVNDSSRIVVGDASGTRGSTVTVTVELEKNLGVAYLTMTATYDTSALTLVSIENGEIIEDMDAGKNLIWSADENATEDGILATLTFQVSDDVESGEYEVGFIVREAYDMDGEDVHFFVSAGHVSVADSIYGDVNNDGSVTGRDVVMLRKYFANYDYDTETSTVKISAGADANGDGRINGKDVLLLRKYFANYDYDIGSSTVVLGPQ